MTETLKLNEVSLGRTLTLSFLSKCQRQRDYLKNICCSGFCLMNLILLGIHEGSRSSWENCFNPSIGSCYWKRQGEYIMKSGYQFYKILLAGGNRIKLLIWKHIAPFIKKKKKRKLCPWGCNQEPRRSLKSVKNKYRY